LTIAQSFAAGFGADIPAIPGTPAGGAGQTRSSVVAVINFVLTFLALVAVVFVIVGGVRILAAGGNEESVTKGRKTILYAIIGLIVIFFARVIIGFFTAELAGFFTN
jgi:membrane glycosyltransferase